MSRGRASQISASSDIVGLVVIIGLIILLWAVSTLMDFVKNNPWSTIVVTGTVILIGLYLIAVIFSPRDSRTILNQLKK